MRLFGLPKAAESLLHGRTKTPSSTSNSPLQRQMPGGFSLGQRTGFVNDILLRTLWKISFSIWRWLKPCKSHQFCKRFLHCDNFLASQFGVIPTTCPSNLPITASKAYTFWHYGSYLLSWHVRSLVNNPRFLRSISLRTWFGSSKSSPGEPNHDHRWQAGMAKYCTVNLLGEISTSLRSTMGTHNLCLLAVITL